MAPPSPKSTAEEVRGLTFAPTLTPSERITLFLSHLTNTPYSGFDKRLIREELQLVSAGPTECVFELTVTPRLADRAGNLHVGAATLLFDVCTTSAMIPRARKGFWQLLGVTRNLSVTTIRPAPVGSELVVESRVVAAEGRLATIVGVIRDKKTQEVVSMVEHLKVDSGPQESKL